MANRAFARHHPNFRRDRSGAKHRLSLTLRRFFTEESIPEVFGTDPTTAWKK
jgi:hypothetical protein